MTDGGAPPTAEGSGLFRGTGAWLWAALALGAAVRLFWVFASAGTHDVAIWQSHAGWIDQHGLVGYYERSDVFNHPPFIGHAMAGLFALSRELGIAFPVLLRLPFAVLDFFTALLLAGFFRDPHHRRLVFAGYWLHPLALIFSAFHGNTDTAVAFFALLALHFTASGRAVAAGAALGVGLWVKLPVALAAPALFFAFPVARDRARFAGTALLVGVSTWLPALLSAPGLVARRVFLYPGLVVETPGGVPIWGLWHVFGIVASLPAGARDAVARIEAAHLELNTLVVLLPIALLVWLRRRERAPLAVGATLCGCFLVFYGLTGRLSFQYLAWSLPFWFFAAPVWLALLTVAASAYVYGLYALLCDDPLLLGRWAWGDHPFWPGWLLALRDATVAVCLAGAGWWLGAALRAELGLASRGRPAE